ncbi:GNAT family N-acetyltransferase [Dermacoccaceae bacterium W4C1]
MRRQVLAELSSGHRVVRAVETDLPAIVTLLIDDPLGAEREDLNDPGYRAAFADIDGDDNQLLVAVLSAQEDVVATFQLTFIPGLSRRGALRSQVEGVRVAESERGTGLGTAVMQWAIDYSQQRGATLVQLTSDSSRTRAHEFYRRLGFVGSHLGMKLRLG